MMLVEALRRLIPGVNYHGEHAEFCPCSADQRIRQKDAAEPLFLVLPVHGQPSQQHRRYDRITGKLFGNLGGQCIHRDAGGRKRVVGRNSS